MSFLKKQAAGFWFSLITLVLTLIGLVFYFVNSSTASFGNIGTDTRVIAMAVIAMVLEIAIIALGQKTEGFILNLLYIAASILILMSFLLFVIPRVDTIASILTFTMNASTLADLESAVAGFVFFVIALITSWISSFLKVAKS